MSLLQAEPSSATDAAVILPLDAVERNTIRHALEASDNNISRAAEALGINRSTSIGN